MSRYLRRLNPCAKRLLLVCLCLSIFGCGQKSPSTSRTGRLAPDFELTSLSGQKVKLSSLLNKEKYVLVAFWATWCPPCVREIPELNRLQKVYSEELEILAINVQEKPEVLEKFRKKTPMDYTVLLDVDGRVTGEYGVEALPVAILLAKQGQIIYYGFTLPDVGEYMTAENRHTN